MEALAAGDHHLVFPSSLVTAAGRLFKLRYNEKTCSSTCLLSCHDSTRQFCCVNSVSTETKLTRLQGTTLYCRATQTDLYQSELTKTILQYQNDHFHFRVYNMQYINIVIVLIPTISVYQLTTIFQTTVNQKYLTSDSKLTVISHNDIFPIFVTAVI